MGIETILRSERHESLQTSVLYYASDEQNVLTSEGVAHGIEDHGYNVGDLFALIG